MPTRRSPLTFAGAVFALTLAAPPFAQSDRPIPVVATFSILGDMVQWIGGEHVALTTLVGPDGDTHMYRPTRGSSARRSSLSSTGCSSKAGWTV